MNKDSYEFAKEFIIQHIEAVTLGLNSKQWDDLMCSIQDAMFYKPPKLNPKEVVKIRRRILNPDIKEFVEQTNRRLNNG